MGRVVETTLPSLQGNSSLFGHIEWLVIFKHNSTMHVAPPCIICQVIPPRVSPSGTLVLEITSLRLLMRRCLIGSIPWGPLMRFGWSSKTSVWATRKFVGEKYELLKVDLNEFKMIDDEGVEQMYSRMGVLIQNINALDVANLTEQEIIRKILQTLPKPKYNIVKVLIFEKDFTTLTITEVVNKIRSHEMFMMGDVESSTSNSSFKKDPTLKASVKVESASRPLSGFW
jgi:hypothetical protein